MRPTALGLALVLLGCAGGSMGDDLRVRGTIRHLDLEGGAYAIAVDDSTRYQPMNLPPEFQRDGVRVRATLRLREEMMGIHQFGKLVEVVEIQADSGQ